MEVDIDKKMDEVRKLAIQLMKKHKLKDWTFEFDNAKTRLGSCLHAKKIISLTRSLIQYGTDAEIKDTILHEIAHALLPYRHAHDEVWKAKAVEIGCSGNRCSDADIPSVDVYVGVCPNNHTSVRHRRGLNHACSICCDGKGWSEKYLFKWHFHKGILKPRDLEKYKM